MVRGLEATVEEGGAGVSFPSGGRRPCLCLSPSRHSGPVCDYGGAREGDCARNGIRFLRMWMTQTWERGQC